MVMLDILGDICMYVWLATMLVWGVLLLVTSVQRSRPRRDVSVENDGRPVELDRARDGYLRTGTDPAALEADVAGLERAVDEALRPVGGLVIQELRRQRVTWDRMNEVSRASLAEIEEELERRAAYASMCGIDSEWWNALNAERSHLLNIERTASEIHIASEVNGWRIKRFKAPAGRGGFDDVKRVLGGQRSSVLRRYPVEERVIHGSAYPGVRYGERAHQEIRYPKYVGRKDASDNWRAHQEALYRKYMGRVGA